MNVTTLSVSGALPGILNFTLERSGEKVQDEVQDLVRQDAVVLVEATKVTDRNAQFLEAVSVGQENLSKARFDVAIDIQASRRFVQPL